MNNLVMIPTNSFPPTPVILFFFLGGGAAVGKEAFSANSPILIQQGCEDSAAVLSPKPIRPAVGPGPALARQFCSAVRHLQCFHLQQGKHSVQPLVERESKPVVFYFPGS